MSWKSILFLFIFERNYMINRQKFIFIILFVTFITSYGNDVRFYKFRQFGLTTFSTLILIWINKNNVRIIVSISHNYLKNEAWPIGSSKLIHLIYSEIIPSIFSIWKRFYFV